MTDNQTLESLYENGLTIFEGVQKWLEEATPPETVQEFRNDWAEGCWIDRIPFFKDHCFRRFCKKWGIEVSRAVDFGGMTAIGYASPRKAGDSLQIIPSDVAFEGKLDGWENKNTLGLGTIKFEGVRLVRSKDIPALQEEPAPKPEDEETELEEGRTAGRPSYAEYLVKAAEHLLYERKITIPPKPKDYPLIRERAASYLDEYAAKIRNSHDETLRKCFAKSMLTPRREHPRNYSHGLK